MRSILQLVKEYVLYAIEQPVPWLLMRFGALIVVIGGVTVMVGLYMIQSSNPATQITSLFYLTEGLAFLIPGVFMVLRGVLPDLVTEYNDFVAGR